MRKIAEIVYNIPQLCFLLSQALIRVLEWGRGTGKSTIISKFIIDCVTEMPRSTGVCAAKDYAQITTRTLPSTISGLEQHGIYKDIHYFVGKKAPSSFGFPEPHEPPLNWKNAIHFWNGSCIVFVSQNASSSSGRGINADWVFADEAALLDEKKFETDVVLTNRGNLRKIADYPDGSWKYYEDCKLHHSMLLATSTPITAAGRWIFKYESMARENPEKVWYHRASAKWNIHNLGKEWFQNARRILPDFLYNAEVLNIRLLKVENGFYPKLDEKLHAYKAYDDDYYSSIPLDATPDCTGDTDLDINEPLIGGLDWGTSINCLVLAQGDSRTMRFLNNMYVKYPSIVDDLCDKFIEYYRPHKNKTLYLWYDPTGNLHTANSRTTLAEQVKENLERAGWLVVLMTEGRSNELHESKYHLWNNILAEDPRKNYPTVRFNENNCSELLISMVNAPAKTDASGGIKKDKGSERNKSIPQEHATHFSDAVDVIVVGMYNDLLFMSQDIPDVPRMIG